MALVVSEGELELSHSGTWQVVPAGNFVFMPALRPVSYSVKDSCEIVWLHLSPENEYWQEFSGLGLQVKVSRNARKLVQLMEALYDECVVPDAGNSMIQQLLCQLILQYLREDLHEMVHHEPLRPRLEECFRFVGESPEHG